MSTTIQDLEGLQKGILLSEKTSDSVSTPASEAWVEVPTFTMRKIK